MALRNINNKVLKAWYEMLHNNISVPVYRTDAPASEEGNYVLLRKESDSEISNNSAFVTRPVIITEVVTRFSASIDEGVAQEIDDEIAQLLYPSAGQNGLPIQADIQITTVNRVNATDIAEDDGTFKYYRIITRNVHRVIQLITLTLGDELITNGSFTGNASDWTLGNGWSYSNNNVLFNYASVNGQLSQLGRLTEGSEYKVSLNIGGTNGIVSVQLGSGEAEMFDAGVGDVSFFGIWLGPGTSGGVIIRISPSSNFNGTIDNVSVKEVI